MCQITMLAHSFQLNSQLCSPHNPIYQILSHWLFHLLLGTSKFLPIIWKPVLCIILSHESENWEKSIKIKSKIKIWKLGAIYQNKIKNQNQKPALVKFLQWRKTKTHPVVVYFEEAIRSTCAYPEWPGTSLRLPILGELDCIKQEVNRHEAAAGAT